MEFSSASPSGSSKRVKTPGNQITISVSCLVDGCASDLSQCREYHRRHKVCELHSKTPKVTIGGREQRFCQQCSRFHSLTEFDEGKRSCRKRLDGHNRRRRKPPSDSLSRTAGMFLSTQHGTRILSFASLQMHPSAVVGSDWAGKPLNAATPPFDNHLLPLNCFDRHNLYSDSSSSSSSAAQSSNKGGRAAANQFHLFQCGPTLAASADNQHQTSNSNRALSLLSSPEPTHQTPEIAHPTASGLGHYTFVQEMDNEGVISDSNGDNDGTTLQFQGMFHNDRGGSSPADARQHTLSFRWD